MFTGTTIEELIDSVERAERHAREMELQDSAMPELWSREVQHPELIEVA